jgi:hypothetical protein
MMMETTTAGAKKFGCRKSIRNQFISNNNILYEGMLYIDG